MTWTTPDGCLVRRISHHIQPGSTARSLWWVTTPDGTDHYVRAYVTGEYDNTTPTTDGRPIAAVQWVEQHPNQQSAA